MPLLNLADLADSLPATWKSRVIGEAGDCNIKVLKMDGQSSTAETHDYNEALIVMSGAYCHRLPESLVSAHPDSVGHRGAFP